MRKSIRQVLIPVAFFTGATVVMTWPLTLNMSHSVAGQFGDNVQNVWLIGWFEKALFQLHQSPLYVPSLNYPDGWNLAYTEVPVTMIVPALPVSLVAGPVAGFNTSIFLSYVLSGLAVYLWMFRATGDRMSALLAGSVFAFSPYRYSHFLAGHLSLLGTQWIALYFMMFIGCLLDRGRRAAYPLLAALSLGLIALTSQYYLYMTLLLSVFVLFVKFVWLDRHRSADRAAVYRLGLFALVGIPVVVLALVPYLQLNAVGDMPGRSVEYVRQYSASPTDFVLPSTVSIIWGEWVGKNFERAYWIEATLYLGAFASVLAAVGVLRARRSWLRGSVILVLAFTLAAVILALGTDLHWLSQPVRIDVPAFLLDWHTQPKAYVPLPGRALFEWLPFYDRMRVWMRYGVFALLGISVLAGYGSYWVSRQRQGWRQSAVSIGLLAFVLLDFLPRPQGYVRVEPRPVDEWLAAQTAPGALVEFPFEKIVDQAQLYYTLIHQKPFLGGSFNSFSPPQYQRIRPVLDSFPDRESVDLLRTLGVRYVLVHSQEYPDFDETDHLVRELGLRWSASFGGIYVYQLEGGSSAP